MREVQELIAGDVFMIFVQQIRNQALKIYTNVNEEFGENGMGKSIIYTKKFEVDFLISTPKNLIEDAEEEILNLNEKVKLLERGVQILNEEVKALEEKNILSLQQIEEVKKEVVRLEDGESTLKNEIEELNKEIDECRFNIVLSSILLTASSTLV
jgi:chromosome segregation ATPase